MGLVIGHQYRLARTLQQHYDQIKEQKDAAERALQAHLTATRPSNPWDRCGMTGHPPDSRPTLIEPLTACQLCGEGGHDAMGCPHNVVTRKREPCHNCGQTIHQTDSCPHITTEELVPLALGMRQEKFLTRPPAMPVVKTEEDFKEFGIKEEQGPRNLRRQRYVTRKYREQGQDQGAPPPNQTDDRQQPPPPLRGRKHWRDEEPDRTGKGAPGGGGGGGDGDGDGSDRDPDESDDETDDTDEARTRGRQGKRQRIVNKIVVDTGGFEEALKTLSEGLQTMISKQDTINKGLVDYTSHHNTSISEQKSALDNLVEDVGQRDYKRMFDVITPYDGEDPQECEVWLEALESACEISGKDCRKMAYALS